MKTDLLCKRFLRPLLVAAIALPLLAVGVSAQAQIQTSVLRVNIEGATGSGPDIVGFNGPLTVSTRVIPDPVFSSPTVLELVIDFSSVVGVNKAGGKKFLTEAQTIVHRPLLAFDQIEVTFPYRLGAAVQSARTANVLLAVSFNAASGVSMTAKTIAPP
ncbi:MAG: hypothetical protein HQ445_14090 [Polaromonas sp.]|nr:hypothetical protein [Polaromonas sp.]